jgi:hypothetical protein
VLQAERGFDPAPSPIFTPMSPSAAIERVVLHPLTIPLKAPFVTSLGALEAVANVVVHVRTREGRTGWGECSPFWTINGETQETCLAVGAHLARTLLGHDATDIEGAHARMDRLIFGNNSIKSAFDIALHDLAAQHADLPLWKYLGGERCFDPVTDYTVSLGDPEKMAADAEAIVAAGGSGPSDRGFLRSPCASMPTRAGTPIPPFTCSTCWPTPALSIARNRYHDGSSWSSAA